MKASKGNSLLEKLRYKIRDWIRIPDSWMLVSLGGVALLGGGIWAFAALADEVLEGDTGKFDEAVLLAMRNPSDHSDPVGPEWVEEMGRDFTALGGVAILSLLTAAVLGYLLLVHKRRAALLVFVAISTGIAASFLLKSGFSRPRPDLVPHESYVYTSSFPSGHSMMSALVYLTLAALLASVEKAPRVKIYLMGVATLLTFVVGISRVYVGVHWPTDVLAGWLAGAVWAAGAWMIAIWLQKRGDIEQEGPEPEIAAEEKDAMFGGRID